jgi:hypothetical protein
VRARWSRRTRRCPNRVRRSWKSPLPARATQYGRVNRTVCLCMPRRKRSGGRSLRCVDGGPRSGGDARFRMVDVERR